MALENVLNWHVFLLMSQARISSDEMMTACVLSFANYLNLPNKRENQVERILRENERGMKAG